MSRYSDEAEHLAFQAGVHRHLAENGGKEMAAASGSVRPFAFAVWATIFMNVWVLTMRARSDSGS